MRQLLTLDEAAHRMGFKSRAFIYRQVKKGLLPKPVQVGEKCVRCVPAELDEVAAAWAVGASPERIKALVKDIEKRRQLKSAELDARSDPVAARAAEIKAIAESIAPVARGANPWD